MVRVRFAPSPTGSLHLGNALTAVANRRFADTHGGALVLRIDDTDPSRTVEGGEEAILGDLAWVEVQFEEGPVRQSERGSLYVDAAERALASDVKMPKKDGIELMAELKAVDSSVPVIILTAFGTVETAVEAMKRGAADYLTKPIARDDLLLRIARVLKLRRLEAENEDLRETLNDRFRFASIIGLSPAMNAVFDTLRKVAGTDATVGFTTALEIATDAIDRLHSTAHSHHRIIVAELMGNRAGWLTLGAGLAGGADVILIPEIPYRVTRVAEAIRG